jgi:hypothetical protein
MVSLSTSLQFNKPQRTSGMPWSHAYRHPVGTELRDIQVDGCKDLEKATLSKANHREIGMSQNGCSCLGCYRGCAIRTLDLSQGNMQGRSAHEVVAA